MMKKDLEIYNIYHTDDDPEFILLGYDTEITYEVKKYYDDLLDEYFKGELNW